MTSPITPAERFAAVLEKYDFQSIAPLEFWSTDDLIDLQEAIRAELQERDVAAQNDYFEQDKDWHCVDPFCPCNNSYGGTE